MLRVTKTATQELGGHHRPRSCQIILAIQRQRGLLDSQAKKPSSSSLRLGAGNGAPGPSSEVGSLT